MACVLVRVGDGGACIWFLGNLDGIMWACWWLDLDLVECGQCAFGIYPGIFGLDIFCSWH